MSSFHSILGPAAAWPQSYVHRLPDSAFLAIQPGGRLDSLGKTEPRSLRHLPVHDGDGSLDVPHLRDAIAQIPNAGPWLGADARDALLTKAKGLLSKALGSTHKAARAVPDWALGYLSHLDRHEALGIERDDAHASWRGDRMVAKRATDWTKAYTKSSVAKAEEDTEPRTKALRRKVADINARAGDRPGAKTTLKALLEVHDRGTAAFDAAKRPAVKSRDQWGMGRVNAFLRLASSGKADHPRYTADNDLLAAGHPRAVKAGAAAKPGTVVRPTPAVPAAAATTSAATKPGVAKTKPPRGKAPLPAKAAQVLSTGTEVARTGGTPVPDLDMPWLAAESVPLQLDDVSTLPAHNAQLPRTAASELGIAPSDRSKDVGKAVAKKDELGEADLGAGGRLAPQQGIGDEPPGFERRTWAGIPLVIDRPKGTVQTGIGKDGNTWERTYANDYGYVPATLGGDDEELDVFLGPDEAAPVAYVAVQQDDDGDFDEFKVFLGFKDEEAARACYLAHIPGRFLERMFEVPVSLLQAMLGLEPVEILKAAETKRRTFGFGPDGKVQVRWPTSSVVFSPPAADEHEDEPAESSRGGSSTSSSNAPPATSATSAPVAGGAAAIAAAAPRSAQETYDSFVSTIVRMLRGHVLQDAVPPPRSGSAPEAASSFIALSVDDLEAAAKAGRAVQGLLPEDPARHARHVVPAPGETEKGLDGGTMLFSPESMLDTDPEALAAYLATFKTPWLAEYPDNPKARRALSKAGKVFAHADVPGSIFVSSYAVAKDAGSITYSAGGTEEAEAPKGAQARPTVGADADHGLPAGMVDGDRVAKARGKRILTVEIDDGAGYDCLKQLITNVEKFGAPGHSFGIVADETTTGADLIPKSGKKINLGYWDGDGGAHVEITHVEHIEPPPRDPDASVLGKRKDGWYAYSDQDGSRIGGPYTTKGEAVDRLRQVETPKSMTTAAIDRHDLGDAVTKAGKPLLAGTKQAIAMGYLALDVDGNVVLGPKSIATEAEPEAIAKADLAFLTIGKAADGSPREERYVLGPVLIPETTDKQGDIISAEEIEKAERRFMELYQNMGLQHAVTPDQIKGFKDANPELANGKILLVESYIVRDDRGTALIAGRQVKSGTWLMGAVYEDGALWQEIKTGKRTGFSIGGLARRTPIVAAEPARA